MNTTSSKAIRAATRAKYLPAKTRKGSVLCLSGGGYRAAIFHMGVCRRLNELRLLPEFDSISAVSGGSIFAAFLARRILEGAERVFNDYEDTIAAPFRQLVKIDIRTGPALTRLLPWEWSNAGAGVEALADQYERHFFGKLTLGDLPPSPRFIFSATDLVFGVNWKFSKAEVGDYQAGSMTKEEASKQSLAVAVAASSCFPPVFRPLPMNLDPDDLTGGRASGHDRDDCVRQLALCDGGVYDNMGLEPVWKDCQMIFVSDGGKPFRFAKAHDTPQQLYRIHDIMANQAEAVRKRWLIAGFLRGDYTGAYLGIQNSVSEYPLDKAIGYSKSIASEVIAEIRTDLDSFSDSEIAVLENHGYTLADAAYRAHISPDGLVTELKPPNDRWWPGDPFNDNFEEALREALSDSSTIHVLGH